MSELRINDESGHKGRSAHDMLSGYGLEMGRIHPQATDLEGVVLGVLISDQSMMSLVMELLTPESFYVEAHKVIYATLCEMYNDGIPIDILTLAQELRKISRLDDVGGPHFIAQLSDMGIPTANIPHHAKIIAQKFMRREMIRVGAQIVRDGFEDTVDPFDLMKQAAEGVESVVSGVNYGNSSDLKELDQEIADDYAKVESGFIPEGSIKIGLSPIDSFFGYFEPEQNIKIAGRPGMGKTALLLAMNLSVAKQGTPVLIWTLEMSARQFFRRLVCYEAGVSIDKVRRGKLGGGEKKRFNQAREVCKSLPIHILDCSGRNIDDARVIARQYKQNFNIGMISNDYIQLWSASTNHGQRESQISHISKTIKQIAKDIKVPFLDCVQLSRETERRAGNRPQLSDLRESGALEQDADIVIMLYRPAYYQDDAVDKQGNDISHLIRGYVRKNRDGDIGHFDLHFDAGRIGVSEVEAEVVADDELPF